MVVVVVVVVLVVGGAVVLVVDVDLCVDVDVIIDVEVEVEVDDVEEGVLKVVPDGVSRPEVVVVDGERVDVGAALPDGAAVGWAWAGDVVVGAGPPAGGWEGLSLGTSTPT